MKKSMVYVFSVILFFQFQDANAGKRKVLLIGVDGVRSDILKKLHTPAFEYLSKHGFGTYESWHQDITMSGPSWSSILCGVYHDKHGVTDNSFHGKNYINYPMLPKLAKQINPELKFGMYMEWKSFLKNSSNNEWDDVRIGEMANTDKTTKEVSDWIMQSDLDFYFVYYGAVDYWGHRLGFSSQNPFYTNAIQNVDQAIAELMKALKTRTNYQDEDWLILFTTDHGGHGLTHGGYSENERQVFWFAYSDRISSKQIESIDEGNVNENCNLVCSKNKRNCPVQPDIAVTALHHLLYDTGCNPEECNSWHLDGKSWLKSMGLQSDKKQIQNIAVIDNTQ